MGPGDGRWFISCRFSWSWWSIKRKVDIFVCMYSDFGSNKACHVADMVVITTLVHVIPIQLTVTHLTASAHDHFSIFVNVIHVVVCGLRGRGGISTRIYIHDLCVSVDNFMHYCSFVNSIADLNPTSFNSMVNRYIKILNRVMLRRCN